MSVVNEFSNDLFDDEDFIKRIEARKKRKVYRFFTRLVFFILIWATLLTYYLTSISRVGIPHVLGNYYLTPSEVLELSGLKKDSFLINLNQQEVHQKISESPRVKTVKIEWSPFKLTIKLNEVVPIAKSINNEVILSNGELLNDYLITNPSYDLSESGLHLSAFINSPFIQETRQIAFLENLKLIDKEVFTTIDYLDITIFQDSSSMYFGIYVKILDKTYIRIRATFDDLNELYEKHTLESVIGRYSEFNINTDVDNDILYYDATCRKSNQTNKLQCIALR